MIKLMHHPCWLTALLRLCVGLAVAVMPGGFGWAAEPASEVSLPTLTTAQQVIDLGMEGARLNPHPVQIRGVLTYLAAGYPNWIFVQDHTAGLLVIYSEAQTPLKEGQMVEVQGTAGVGAFHTYVTNGVVRVVGEGTMPVARRTPAAKLVAGADFGQWVRITATVRDAALVRDRLLVQASSDGHPFYVVLKRRPGQVLPADWIDAEVDLEGVVWTQTDLANRAIGFRVHLPESGDVRLLRAGSTNTFDKPATTSKNLRRVTRNQDDRVKVRGVVTHFNPAANMLTLHDGTGPIGAYLLRPILLDPIVRQSVIRDPKSESVKQPPKDRPKPGDRIELVGAPSAEAPYEPMLHAGEYRIIGTGSQPPPRAILGQDGLLPQNDGELVRLRARFVDRDLTSSGSLQVLKLWLESDGLMFEARLIADPPLSLDIPNNSLLEVTGICTPIFGDLRQPRGMRLQLRDVQDIRVLQEGAPWLSRRAVQILAGAGAMILFALAWVGLLRRQVRQQTAELRNVNQDLLEKIEQHQRAEAALAESEARHRTLTEHAPEAIVAFELESGRFEAVNENAERLFGLSHAELLKRGPVEVSPEFQPDGRRSREAAREWIDRAVGGETPVFEWVHRHASGRLIPCEVRIVRLPTVGRTVIRGSIIDNSERRRRELVQRATYQISEAVHAVDDLKSLYQRIHAIVKGLMPADNFFLLLHDPATDLHFYAYHVDQMDVWPAPRKVSGGLVGYILRTSRSLLVDRASMMDEQNEWHFVSGTPSAVWLGVPLIVRGKTIGVMAVQDYQNPKAYGEDEKQILTYVAAQTALAIDRKRADAALTESEARTRLIVDNALDAVITMDADGVIRGWNSQAERTFGWRADEAIGRPLAETIIPPAHRDAHQRGLKQFTATGEGMVMNKRVEIAAMHRDGHEFPVELAIAPLKLGNTWIFSGFARDISERRKAEEEMQRALAREKELSALKSSFVSLVSHEFRTPLGVIMSASDVLDRYLDRLAPEKRRKHLDMIFRATRNLAELVEGVLLLGKVEQGRMQFTPSPVDLPGFCRQLADEVLSATVRRCPIEMSVPSDLPPAVGDPSLLRHILTNVLSNAVKYSEAGAQVEFTVERNGPEATLTVRDHGIGIPDEDRENLFKSFARGRNVGSRPGTGLGLLIVKRCVDLHAGDISIESRPGEGTAVTITLPLFIEAPMLNPLETKT